jgi:hypothetical protein
MSFIYNKQSVVFQIPTAVSVQIIVGRDVTPCTLISAAPIFKLKCICTEDFITTFYRNVILYKPGASISQSHNLKTLRIPIEAVM